jgi:myo-inositol-1-phosphate synthase
MPLDLIGLFQGAALHYHFNLCYGECQSKKLKRNSMKKAKIAIVGIGNCASALVQGLHYYKDVSEKARPGILHLDIGGYRPADIEVVAAIDVDTRKVGKPLSEAIYSKPNCSYHIVPTVPESRVNVIMGQVHDGVSNHMQDFEADEAIVVSQQPESSGADVVNLLTNSETDILVNYLPVGSEQATRFYAECALSAGVGFVNCIPVFIASAPEWEQRFRQANLPLIGDDIKSQIGATIVHRKLVDLFQMRGVRIKRTYQINVGGNTDFLNMLNRDRLASKKISKSEAVQARFEKRLPDQALHVGPSDYVPWLDDNKVAFMRVEGEGFGGAPVNIEMRLDVEDSPNSAGSVIDAIRCCKVALDRSVGGVLEAASAFYCKHPPQQYRDEEALARLEGFIAGDHEN